jgi:hypothetical protein
MNKNERIRQSDIAAKREYQQSLRRAKKLAKEQRIELSLEETILIVQAARLCLDSRNGAEAVAFIDALPRELINRGTKLTREQLDELRSYARTS